MSPAGHPCRHRKFRLLLELAQRTKHQTCQPLPLHRCGRRWCILEVDRLGQPALQHGNLGALVQVARWRHARIVRMACVRRNGRQHRRRIDTDRNAQRGGSKCELQKRDSRSACSCSTGKKMRFERSNCSLGMAQSLGVRVVNCAAHAVSCSSSDRASGWTHRAGALSKGGRHVSPPTAQDCRKTQDFRFGKPAVTAMLGRK